MLKSIKRFFDDHLAPTDQGQRMDDEHVLRLAVAALLLEVGESDYQDHPAERDAVMEAVKNHFDLEQAEADALIELAESERAGATDYFQFTSLINRTYDQEQKKRVIEILWKVAFADGELHKYEEHLIRRLAELLHLPHRDFIAAKHRVMGEN
jgi:uncharacterized tellurite resistance protein B-like protein